MGGIELLNPRGLWLLSGLVPLIVLYILKIRRERVKIASTWLWAAAQRDLLAKAPFRRLIAELPLVLQILALIALAVALSRPALRGNRIDGDHIAIVVDTSASMATLVRDSGPPGPSAHTRMTDAQSAASDIISRLSPGADAILIEGAKEARVLAPLQRDEQKLKATASSLAVREVEGDLSEAVALAVDRLRSLGGKRRVVVITDGALAHDAPLSASGMDLQVVTVGDDEDNAAIVRVDIRSGIDPARGPEGASPREQVQVFAMVRNYAPRPRDAFVTLTLAGSADPIASRRVLVGANDKSPVVLTFEPAPLDHGRGLVVRISPGDALALDDVAFGRVPAGLKMPVTIASASSYSWVARALAADPDLDIQKLSLAQLGTVNVDPEALVVVEGACPAIVPGRDAMIVAPPPGTCHGIDVGKSVDNPQLTSWESSDPRFRFLTLDGVHVSRARSLLAQGAGASLLRATETTLIADASIPGRAVTLIGFDVGDSDWPLKASFVLFVRNVVELARLHRAQGVAGPARTGEPLRVAVPTLAPSIRVEGPGVAAHDVAAKGGFAIVPSIDRAGLYRVSWSAPNVGGELIAANLTSELESDIRPRRVVQDGNGDASATPRSKVEDAHNEWGSWLALLAAALLAFDIYWLTRKPAAPTLRKLPKTGGA